jgi:coenzyme Q-binding protein COQ10
MPEHFDTYKSQHTPQELFDIVADVEKYPDFLPWVSDARIIEKHENWFIAELVVQFKAISQSYSSKVTLYEPDEKQSFWEIDTELVKGPFKKLSNNWKFRPRERDEGTEILFDVDFQFKSIFLDKIIGTIFERAVTKMTSAFEKRADDLLGKVEK